MRFDRIIHFNLSYENKHSMYELAVTHINCSNSLNDHLQA